MMKTGASSLLTGSSQKREEVQAHIKDKAEEEAHMPFKLINDTIAQGVSYNPAASAEPATERVRVGPSGGEQARASATRGNSGRT